MDNETFSSEVPMYDPSARNASSMHSTFWERQKKLVESINPNYKFQDLPLARIKKIMKLDEDVKMISAETLVLLAKAAEIFIADVSIRAWYFTEDSQRRTLQKNDVSIAVSSNELFDFLLDIVPREEGARNSNKKRAMHDSQMQYFQLATAAAATNATNNPLTLSNPEILATTPAPSNHSTHFHSTNNTQVIKICNDNDATASVNPPQIFFQQMNLEPQFSTTLHSDSSKFHAKGNENIGEEQNAKSTDSTTTLSAFVNRSQDISTGGTSFQQVQLLPEHLSMLKNQISSNPQLLASTNPTEIGQPLLLQAYPISSNNDSNVQPIYFQILPTSNMNLAKNHDDSSSKPDSVSISF